jgi:hypothetical protein
MAIALGMRPSEDMQQAVMAPDPFIKPEYTLPGCEDRAGRRALLQQYEGDSAKWLMAAIDEKTAKSSDCIPPCPEWYAQAWLPLDRYGGIVGPEVVWSYVFIAMPADVQRSGHPVLVQLLRAYASNPDASLDTLRDDIYDHLIDAPGVDQDKLGERVRGCVVEMLDEERHSGNLELALSAASLKPTAGATRRAHNLVKVLWPATCWVLPQDVAPCVAWVLQGRGDGAELLERLAGDQAFMDRIRHMASVCGVGAQELEHIHAAAVSWRDSTFDDEVEHRNASMQSAVKHAIDVAAVCRKHGFETSTWTWDEWIDLDDDTHGSGDYPIYPADIKYVASGVTINEIPCVDYGRHLIFTEDGSIQEPTALKSLFENWLTLKAAAAARGVSFDYLSEDICYNFVEQGKYTGTRLDAGAHRADVELVLDTLVETKFLLEDTI